MYKVIGTEGCSKCLMVKKKLEDNGIEFGYKLFSQLSKPEQGRYLNIAAENKVNSFPLVFDENDNFIKMEEIQ